MCDYENLYQAYLKARKQKRFRSQVLQFSYALEENLITLQNELLWRTYRVGPYKQFTVYEPKQRLISALAFRDRVVQHAIANVIEPIFERVMIYDSFACRKGRGTLAASNRLSYFMGKSGTSHYLKCDIAKFFPSVDTAILRNLVARRVPDEGVLWLVDSILQSATVTGIPIGNLLSQMFANVYLHELDHFMKVTRGTKYYLRYMDDFIVLADSPAKLRLLLDDVRQFLADKLHLFLNAKTTIGATRDGIAFVGYRTFPKNRLIRKSSLIRMNGKFRAWQGGKVRDKKFALSIGSWVGHAKGTASHGFVEKMLLKSLWIAIEERGA